MNAILAVTSKIDFSNIDTLLEEAKTADATKIDELNTSILLTSTSL